MCAGTVVHPGSKYKDEHVEPTEEVIVAVVLGASPQAKETQMERELPNAGLLNFN